jgi:hypothetical protein
LTATEAEALLATLHPKIMKQVIEAIDEAGSGD